MSFAKVLGLCTDPVGGHMLGGHVRNGNPKFNPAKSYFTDQNALHLNFEDTMKRLAELLKAARRAAGTNADQGVRIDVASVGGMPGPKLRKIDDVPLEDEDPATKKIPKIGIAFTDGSLVGLSQRGTRYTWVYFFLTKTPKPDRHQWVTAFPGADLP